MATVTLATGVLALSGATVFAQPSFALRDAAVIQVADQLLDHSLPATKAGRVILAEAGTNSTAKRFYYHADNDRPADFRDTVIVLDGGVHDLNSLQAALPDPGWLDCDAVRCTLSAPLVVNPETTLVIAGVKLRMLQGSGAAIMSNGELYISGADIEGWNARLDAPAATDADGSIFRPFIAAVEDSHTLIRTSRLAHLGYQSPMSYGLSFARHYTVGKRTGSPSVDMVSNVVLDAYFGFFTFDADGVRVIGNRIKQSHVYAIDPHDDTRNMLIAENVVSGSQRSHGIILSRRIHDSAVLYNTSFANAGSGIFVDKASHDIVIEGNDVYWNDKDGIVVHESRAIRISGNFVTDNAADGIRIRASAEIEITGNRVARSGRFGVVAYDWSYARNPPREEERGQILAVSIKVEDNSLAENVRGACSLRGDILLLGTRASDC